MTQYIVETGYVCWAGVENIDDLRPLTPGSDGRVLSPSRQIDPPAAKFMTNSIKLTKRLSEIKNDKNWVIFTLFPAECRRLIWLKCACLSLR